MARILLSEKGRPKLIFDGYGYVKESDCGNKTHWRCEFKTSKSCKGRAHTIIGAQDGDRVEIRNKHNHLPAATRVEVIETTNRIKHVASTTQEETHTIVSSAVNAVSPVAAPSLLHLSCMKRTFWR